MTDSFKLINGGIIIDGGGMQQYLDKNQSALSVSNSATEGSLTYRPNVSLRSI
jgi:hypothetical protein